MFDLVAIRANLVPFSLLTIAVTFIHLSQDRVPLDDRASALGSTSIYVQASNPPLVRILSCGNHTVVSALVWTGAILDFAETLVGNRASPGLPSSLNLVTELDTLWKYPYEFSGLVLEGPRGKPDSMGLAILERGVRRFPSDGKLAILYVQQLSKVDWLDSTRLQDSLVAILLPLTSGSVNAPDFARTYAFTLLSEHKGGLAAVEHLVQSWAQESDPLIRLLFQNKLPKYLATGIGLEGDSLMAVSTGVAFALNSGEPGVEVQVSQLLRDLESPLRRSQAYLVFQGLARTQAASVTTPESGSSKNP